MSHEQNSSALPISNPIKKTMNSKGQVEVTFNWIYILVAGTVILLFFAGIIIKQKVSSEEKLASNVIRTLESIYTGASVSEKTKNVVPTSGLIDYTFDYSCTDGTSFIGIQGQSARYEESVQPIFSPTTIRTARLILWSLPYNYPFKTSDLLFVTSDNTLYLIVGESEFKDEFIKAAAPETNTPARINVLDVSSEEFQAVNPGKQYQVRVIDVSGNIISNNDPVPEKLRPFDDHLVTALRFSPDGKQVEFFTKKGDAWKSENQGNPIPILSLGGEKDAAKYAAIFAGSSEIYTCNMAKALKRLQHVHTVYSLRYEELKTIVNTNPASECPNLYEGFDTNLQNLLQKHKLAILTCLQSITNNNDLSACSELQLSADALHTFNSEKLANSLCPALY